jgi:uncharacterized coiled-coil protein SlyX
MSDARLTELESRYAWLEKHVADQDKIMLEMGEEVRRLRRDLEKVRAPGGGGGSAESEPEAPERPPPHY